MNWLTAPFKWILNGPARWLGKARGAWGWSMPLRVAVVLSIFLALCIIGYYVASYFAPDATSAPKSTDAWFIGLLFLLWIAVPVSAYFAVRAWLETEPTEYPDIDTAWNEGIRAIGRAGLNLDEIPFYLVLGLTSVRSSDNLVRAAGWELLVEGKPDGGHPLRWYATDDAVLLCLLDACATSEVQSGALSADGAVPSQQMNPTGVRGTMIGGMAASSASETSVPQSPPGRGVRGTILAQPDASQQGSSGFGAAPTDTASGGGSNVRGTMLAGASQGVTPQQPEYQPPKKQDIVAQTDRLKRVCQLARGSRQPLSPLNGTMMVLDWESIQRVPVGSLANAVRDDALAIIDHTQVHSPLCMFVSGMDTERGFLELVRRAGENRAKENRFGHGFDHQSFLTIAQMDALSQHACGAFEDWVYDLFKQSNALSRSNNDRLFALMCKVRNLGQPRLAQVLGSLVSSIPDGLQRGPLLCGCYFGAADGGSRQAFVRSVFQKMFDLEEELEWTQPAVDRERSADSLFGFLQIFNAALIVYLVGLLAYFIFWKSS